MRPEDKAVVQQLMDAARVAGITVQCAVVQQQVSAALAAGKALLEQPEQEPVGKWTGKCIEWTENPYKFKKGQSIYTTPPAQPSAWAELTDEEITLIMMRVEEQGSGYFLRLARAIEAKLRQKNGGAV